MANRETFVANAAESTLSSALASGSTTVNVTDTSDFPAVPFYATVDPGNDSKREIVRATAKTATTLTVVRAEDGTTDVAHDSGAVIAVVPVAALWSDINDRADAIKTTADAAYTPGGADVAVADGGTGASTAAAARTNLGAAAASHASTHSNGGTDEVTVENLGTAATDTSLVLKPDGTGGVNFAAGSATSAVGFFAYKTAHQSIANNSYTQLTFGAEDYDTDALFASPTFTADRAGKWSIKVSIEWASNTTGDRAIAIWKNGASIIDVRQATSNVGPRHVLTADLNLALNDTIDAYGFQNSGGALDAQGSSTGYRRTWFSAHYIGS